MTCLAGKLCYKMAQAKVTEFFNSRKRNADFHPSKRRKVSSIDQGGVNIQEVSKTKASPAISTRTRSRACKSDASNLNAVTGKPVEAELVVKAAKESVKNPRRKATRQPKGKSTKLDTLQKSIHDVFKGQTESNVELPTAACDDHCGSPPSSPSKRPQKANSDEGRVSKKRSKGSVVVRKDLMLDSGFATPEKGYDFSKFGESLEKSDKGNNARKKLILKKPSSSKQDKKDDIAPKEEVG